MIINKKQYLLILIVLLAVIGLIGAGCLGSNDDGKTANGSSNGTGSTTTNTSNNPSDTSINTSNTSNTSGSTSDTSDTDSSSSNSNLPDVVYANQNGGSGGSNRGTPAPTATIAKFGSQSLVVEEFIEYIEGEGDEDDETIYLVYVYVPTSDMEVGDTFDVTFLQSVTGAIEMDGEDVIENIEDGILFSDIQVKGKTVTLTLKQEEIDFGELDDYNLGVLIGDDVYFVSFYASTIWNFDLPTGSFAKIIELGNPAYEERTISGKMTVVTDSKTTDVRITIIPPSDKTIFSVSTVPELTFDPMTSGFDSEYKEFFREYSDVESSIYNVNVEFEAKTKATVNGQSLYVFQTLFDDQSGGRIYVYAPVSDIVGKDLVLTFTGTVIETDNQNSLVENVIQNGKAVTLSIDDSATADDFEYTNLLDVEVNGKVYSVLIFDSNIWNFNVGSNGVMEFNYGGVDYILEGSSSDVWPTMYSCMLTARPADGYVVDTFTITEKGGSVVFDNSGDLGTFSDAFDESKTYNVMLTFKTA
ncbi:hypothetical protein MmiEs2_03860 [Methanimicrococcus stummii]|uniref:Uncharacterized protein n=1 Tax=Methanimicrococcus stummii TaxID=3028294 RepID=A0AA96VKW3_9EURY|nr:hypothetical protein [Methanimicrococcus sp. Es2]WNY28202.1 hypothetical protein MmiEs2_03860 [Methanimicrococcus sp. Es2]